jgi:Ca2+-binding RTX toxin-like protein
VWTARRSPVPDQFDARQRRVIEARLRRVFVLLQGGESSVTIGGKQGRDIISGDDGSDTLAGDEGDDSRLGRRG